uniref:Uncharacterized protein n=1 Tax=Pristionchus pacificus TaxID=54126 RepID=A0A2A6BZX2_PRIPA|eukprot:PDM71396.1 hypothetical protein PRIPAC_37803 [Pristionchus pacificus]
MQTSCGESKRIVSGNVPLSSCIGSIRQEQILGEVCGRCALAERKQREIPQRLEKGVAEGRVAQWLCARMRIESDYDRFHRDYKATGGNTLGFSGDRIFTQIVVEDAQETTHLIIHRNVAPPHRHQINVGARDVMCAVGLKRER